MSRIVWRLVTGFWCPDTRRPGPWKTPADVELATAGYVDWYNNRRLHIHRRDPARRADAPSRNRSISPWAAQPVAGLGAGPFLATAGTALASWQ